MPSQQAAAGGGNGSDGGGSFLNRLYYSLEDKYYALIDYLEQAGLPVGGVVDSFESRGIRTFPLAVLLLAMFVGLAFWLMQPSVATETNFVLSVLSGEGIVEKAVVQVYLGDELIYSANTNAQGTVTLESLPTKELLFSISAKGYASLNKTFDLSLRSRASVELECVGANCLQAMPTPVIDFAPEPTVIVSPPAPSIKPIPSPSIEPPKPVSFSVYVKNNTDKLPISGAAVELRKSLSSRLLGNVTSDANGLAQFDEIESGTSAYLIVSAAGFLKYNGVVANQKVTLDSEGKSRDVFLDTVIPEVNLLPTRVRITDADGNPISALVEFYLNGSEIPYSSATINGEGTFNFPAGTRVTAVVYPPDSTFSSGSFSFNAGQAAATGFVSRLIIDSIAVSCEVVLPGIGSVSVAPGQRLPVTVKFSSKPLAPVSVLCGTGRALATCQGTSCSTQCIFDSTGSRVIQAVAGNTSCVSSRQVSVERVMRSYSIAAAPGTIPLGGKTTVLVSFVDPSNAQGSISISCGEGATVQANCGDTAGTCTAECGPYNSVGSKPILAVVGSEVVAAATVFVQGGNSCNLLISPISPVEQQPVQVFVQFNYSQSVEGFALECGSGRAVQQIQCTGKSGVCTGTCVFDTPGSYGITARSGSQPACAGTVFVNPFALPANATFCGDTAHTPVNTCSQSAPLFCTRFGRLESRASQCGCPSGWRVSPIRPDFCEKLSERKVVGFANGTLSLGTLFNGRISGLTQVLGMRNASAAIFAVINGTPNGAEALVALVNGNLVSAGASSTGSINGAAFAVAVKVDGKPLLSTVTAGKVQTEIRQVLVVAGSVLVLRNSTVDGSLASPETISSVAGATGGYLEVITLDGGPTQCFDGTAVGACSLEKPFVCNSDGARSPKASVCGCPSGWRASTTQPDQCIPVPVTGQACSDGTPSGSCSISARSLKCQNGLLTASAVSCGCPLGFEPQGEQCVQPGPTKTSCSDTTSVNSCSGFKPLFCNSNGHLLSDPARCGCPSVGGSQFVLRDGQCVQAPPAVCADGRTIPGTCKVGDAPWLCGEDASSYSSRASLCQCPVIRGVQWVADGESCIAPPNEFCPDGITRRNTCKLDAQPLFCLNDASGYSEKASQCGCPVGYTQVGDSCLLFQTTPACTVDVFPKIVYPNDANAASILVGYSGFSAVSAAQINASCDTSTGVRTAVNFDARISAFTGGCTYAPAGVNGSLLRTYSAKISTPQAFALCSITPPGNVFVRALPPASCTDAFQLFNVSTPVGSCAVGRPPHYCIVDGNEFSGFNAHTIENSSFCGCPANTRRLDDTCVSNNLPTTCAAQNESTLIGQCSGLDGKGKPYRCMQPLPLNETNKYITELVSDAGGIGGCGCPANKVMEGDDCRAPANGAIAVGVEGSSFRTTEPVRGSLLLTGFNITLANHKQNIFVQCGSADSSGIGVESFNPAQCTTRPNGDMNCSFTCTYFAGDNGTKVISANFSAAGVVWQKTSPPFLVSGWPGGSCSLSADNSNIRLGDRARVSVAFSTPFDVNGVRQVFSGAGDSRYGFHCGQVISPSTGAFQQLAPITTLSCSGSNGTCSATCEYLATQIDLNQTSSTQPVFTAFGETPYEFSCSGPLVRIVDTPATVRVQVRHDTRAVPGAEVTLLQKISGLRRVCNTATTNSNGSVSFTQCVSSTGERRSILKDTQVEVAAEISVVGTASSISMEGTSPVVQLVTQTALGVNEITVPIDFATGIVGLRAIDAFTQSATANLSLASFSVLCPSVNLPPLPAAPSLSALPRTVGNCTGSVCDAASRALMMNCRVEVSAPGYRSESYGQPVITSTDSASPANRQTVTAVLVPLTFSANSLNLVKEVYDLEGALSESRIPGVLSLEGLTLKKGFRYLVTTTLRTVYATDRVASFLQASRNKESFIINNTIPGLFYYPDDSTGQIYDSTQACAPAEINYEDPPQPRYYDWLELQSFNTREGGASLAPTGLDFEYQIVPNEFVASNSSALRARSFTFSSTTLPRFVLDPYDADALDSSRHAQVPFCKATAREYNYSLSDSVRKCSPDYQYCVESVFVQPGVSPAARGDGFIAQSALKCGLNNSDHCVDVFARFTLTNNDLRLVPPVVASSTFFSFTSPLDNYEVKGVKFFGVTSNFGGASTSYATISRFGEVLVFKPNALGGVNVVNLTASGVVQSITNNSFQLNLGPLVIPLWGGHRPEVRGEITLKPLHPTVPNARANTAITFSSTSKSAVLNQWSLVVARSGVRTTYGEIVGNALVRQLEQAGDEISFGYDQYAADAFSNVSTFNASAFDCASGASLKGYPCRPVELRFTAKAYQELQNAELFFEGGNSSYEITGLQLNVSDSSGAIKPAGVATVSASGQSFSHSFGSLSQGESVSVLMLVRPPAGESSPKAITIGLRNASTPESSLNVTGFLGSKKRYGLVRVQARDALNSQLLNGTVNTTGSVSVRSGAASFIFFYAGRQQQNCVLAGDDSCIYRLKQISWQGECPFAADLRGAGCVNASVPSGYFAPAPVRLFENGIDFEGTSSPGSVVPGEQRELKFYALKPIAAPSAIQRIEISSSDGIACQSNSDNASVPDCFRDKFALVRGRQYSVSFSGTMKESEKGGLYFAVGNDFSQGRLLRIPLNLSVTTLGSLPVPAYAFAGETSTGTCQPVSENPFVDNPSGLVAVGVNWAQLLTNNSGRSEFPFSVQYSFVVPEFFGEELLKLSFNSFVANRSLFGRELFFRTPDDPALGYDFENPSAGKQWCSANTIDLSARPVDASTHCDALSCISVELQQGSAFSSSPPVGFQAISKRFWQTWQTSPYPPVTYRFKVNVVNSTSSKTLTFRVDPAKVRITVFELSRFCGIGVAGRGSISADGSTFTLAANACTDIGDSEDISGELTLEALPENSTAVLDLEYSGGANRRTSYATTIAIVSPAGIAQSNYATVALQVTQRQVDTRNGVPLSSTISCSPTSGSCGSARFLSTFGNDCTTEGIDNTFSSRGGTPQCHAGWLEFSYDITSIPSAARANFSFQIVSGEAVVAPVPTSLTSTKAALLTRTIDGTQVAASLTPSADGKNVTGSIDTLSLGETFRFTIRLNPRSSGLLNTVMRFNNGNLTELPMQLRIEGRRVQAIACPGPLCPDLLEIHPCGRADLSVSVSTTLQNQLRVNPTCRNAILLIDPIFPADAIPFDFDQSYKDACTGGQDPFGVDYMYFEPLSQSELPAGVRPLDGTQITIDRVRHAIVVNGVDFGLNHDKLVKGNNIVWPGTSTPYAPGAEIGRGKLVVSCPLLSSNVTINVSVKVNSLVTQGPDGNDIQLLNAIDASGVFFQNQAHQLIWALYNGQFPQDVAVEGNNEIGGRTITLPFNPNDRVKFFLTNQISTHLGAAGSYPVKVYPQGDVRSPPASALPSATNFLPLAGRLAPYSSISLQVSPTPTPSASPIPSPTPVPTISPQELLRAGGIVLTDAVHRPGNLMSGLVGEAHRDPGVNGAFQSFIEAGLPLPDGEVATCNAIDYVAKVYKQLPRSFKAFAKKIAFETAFRRAKKPDELLFCAYAKVDAPMYCNQNGNIVLNPAVCGCPYNFRKTTDGRNCEPLNEALYPPSVCADGTLPGHCSQYKPFYCNENKLLVENPSCEPAVPVFQPGKCSDGTPFNSCLRDNTRALVCHGDTGSWRITNIEVEMQVTECTECARVSSPYTANYPISPLVELSAQGTVPGSTNYFPNTGDFTANNAYATTIEASQVEVRAVVSASLDRQLDSLVSVRVEYQRSGRSECQFEGGSWCADSRIFESGSGVALALQGGSQTLYSKTFNAPEDSATRCGGSADRCGGRSVSHCRRHLGYSRNSLLH